MTQTVRKDRNFTVQILDIYRVFYLGFKKGKFGGICDRLNCEKFLE